MESILPPAETPLQAESTRHLPFRIQTGQDRKVFVAARNVLPRSIAPARVPLLALNDCAPESRARERSLPLARQPAGFATDSARPQALLHGPCNHLLTGYHRNLWGGI